MPKFPRSETELIALTQMMTEGLVRMAEDFPNPPFPAAELVGLVTQYNGILSVVTQADMTSQQQHALKDEVVAMDPDQQDRRSFSTRLDAVRAIGEAVDRMVKGYAGA